MNARLIVSACLPFALHACRPEPTQPCSEYGTDLFPYCACIQEEISYLGGISLGCCDDDLMALREEQCRSEQTTSASCQQTYPATPPDTDTAETGKHVGSTCDTGLPSCEAVARCQTASCVEPTCDSTPPAAG